MSLPAFLAALRDTGRVRVATPDESPDAADPAVVDLLAEFDRQTRLDMAYDAPALVPAAATWAATTLYRACQFLMFRAASADVIRQALTTRCPEPANATTVYSADLTFRYLPDLVTLARSAALDDDPLVHELLILACTWPLSSVGVRGVGDVDVSPFIEHAGLCQLYVDRIIARRDTSRLAEPRVRDAVRAAIGLFPLLSPELAKIMESKEASP